MRAPDHLPTETEKLPRFGGDRAAQPDSPRLAHRRMDQWDWALIIGLVVGALVVVGAGGYVYRLINPAATLTTVEDIALDNGPPTRFDYQSIDPVHHWLLVSRSDTNAVLIFDLVRRKVLAQVSGVPDGHGVVAVPTLDRIYAAAGGSNQVVVIDEHTFKILARIPVGANAGPDGMAYDPVSERLFVSDETGENDAVIDVRTDRLIAHIPLSGESGNTQYDAATDTIYVNVETKSELDAINPHTLQVIGRYPLSGCQTNHGLLIDSVNRLLFIACTANATLLEVNMRTMRISDQAAIGNSPDVLALDQSQHLVYVACESGIVSVFVEQGETVHKLEEGYIGPHAHTIGVDQQTHLVYLPLQNMNGHPVLRIAQFTLPSPSS
jgi:YVTN family beta-propeller protein